MTTPAQRVIDRISQVCPQCQGEGRVHKCDHCEFKSCIACLLKHESGHSTMTPEEKAKLDWQMRQIFRQGQGMGGSTEGSARIEIIRGAERGCR